MSKKSERLLDEAFKALSDREGEGSDSSIIGADSSNEARERISDVLHVRRPHTSKNAPVSGRKRAKLNY